ncbi:MAG: hypothetical protein M1818_004871 [Claussenomyces sp. TS43310]|nr:MAG: hypothetical protein M1818_004871 [Claussenomyces sp. TS43310]
MNNAQELTLQSPAAGFHPSNLVTKDVELEDRVAQRREKEEEVRSEAHVMSAEDVTTACQTTSHTIHILGAGNIGKFVAYALAGLADRPTITLLLHHPHAIQQWYDEGQFIDVVRQGLSDARAGFNVEYTEMAPYWPRGQPMSEFDRIFSYSKNRDHWYIEKLVVTTKASFTVSALLSIKDRLGPSSTICFLQNGMGIIDEVNHRVFPNLATRPRYIVGTVSHGLSAHPRKFTCIYHGTGEIFLSLMPASIGRIDPVINDTFKRSPVGRMSCGWTASSRSLLKTLVCALDLVASGLRYGDLLEKQLEKLAVNAVINPLSVIFNCANGQLLHNSAVTSLMREILTEVSKVICSLPEIRYMKDHDRRFSSARLEALVVQVAIKTASNISSMLQDVKNGRRTEVDYINGYIVKRGREGGIDCPVNSIIVQMVKAKSMMKRREQDQYIPFR